MTLISITALRKGTTNVLRDMACFTILAHKEELVVLIVCRIIMEGGRCDDTGVPEGYTIERVHRDNNMKLGKNPARDGMNVFVELRSSVADVSHTTHQKS